MLQELEGLIGRRLAATVIFDGVDTRYWKNPHGAGTRGRTILAAGALRHVKGYDTLLEALRVLCAEDVEFFCGIAGEGPERNALIRTIYNFGLEQRVELLGALPRDDLRRWYGRSKVVVLSSRREGGPNVVLEALACGTPVVSTAVAFVPDILHAPFGEVVAVDAPDALASALKHVLDLDEADWSLASQEARRQALTLDWERSLDLYEDLLAGHSFPAVPSEL